MITETPNGYQIRLAVLQMAQDLMTTEWNSKRDHDEWQYCREVDQATRNGSLNLPSRAAVIPGPTTAAIKAAAGELYDFIKTK